MYAFFSAPRRAQTTVPCPHCSEKLDIRRSCHEAYMSCAACQKDFPLRDFISQMDDAMENFLEQVYSDRV